MSASAEELPVGALRAEYADPGSPFEVVRYEWRWRTSAPMVSVTRVHAGGFGTDTEVGLVDSVRYRQAWDSLDACEARATETQPEGPHLLLEHGSTRPYYVPDPYGSGLLCMRVVRGLIEPVASLPPYRVAFWDEGQFGTIQTRTDDPAWLYVDGRPTQLRTPVSNLRVTPGQRELRWVRLTDGAVREATISVRAGQTTTINIEFRQNTAAPPPSDRTLPPDDADVS